jgi:hypothetical protein
MCERVCGFCKDFPGDGQQCFRTLDVVSYAVKGCDRWRERREEAA